MYTNVDNNNVYIVNYTLFREVLYTVNAKCFLFLSTALLLENLIKFSTYFCFPALSINDPVGLVGFEEGNSNEFMQVKPHSKIQYNEHL